MIGLILAGGYGRRMGKAKADLLIDGEPLYQSIAQVIQNVGVPPYLSVRKDQNFNVEPNLPLIYDFEDGKGPLQAILAALTHSKCDILVTSCDSPTIKEIHLEKLITQFDRDTDVIHFVENEKDHYFPSIWRPALIDPIKKHLQKDLSIRAFLEDVKVKKVHLTEKEGLIVNLNTLEDLEQWKKQ